MSTNTQKELSMPTSMMQFRKQQPLSHHDKTQRQRRRGPFRILLEACVLTCGVIIYSLYLDSTIELPSEEDILLAQQREQQIMKRGLMQAPLKKNNPNALLWIVITSTQARLGNNMFQFASSYGIVSNYKPNPTKLCIHPSFDLHHLNQTVVGPLVPYCPKHIINHASVQVVNEIAYATYNEVEFPPCDASDYCVVMLKGYFQSWRYFEGVADSIRKRFEFLPDIQQDASQVMESLTTADRPPVIIGIHVRRGDMSSKRNQGRFYLREPPVSFYQRAMQHYYEMYQSIQFVIASDDPDWCEENLKPLNNESITILRGNTPAVDLAILTSCHHVIMSRGSYGWWAAWLSGSQAVYYKDAFVLEHPENDGKVVLSDHYPPDWVAIRGSDDEESIV